MPIPFDPIISDNFNGGEIFSVEAVLLKPNELQKAINVRFKLGGGFTNRPGFIEKDLFPGVVADKIQGAFSYFDKEVYVAINGKIYVVFPDFSAAYEIYSGLNATVDVEFLEYNGDIYVMQAGSFPLRIARSKSTTALTALVSVSVTVETGQGWRFGNAGTLRVVSSAGFEDVTYTARANDIITVTAATVNLSHAAGAYIFEVTVLSTAPKIGFGAEFQNTWFSSGNSGEVGQNFQGNTLFYSVGATGLNPEKFYDFAGAGSGYIPVGDKSDIAGLLKTKTYLLILKKNSILYCSGFDNSGIPIILPLTETYGTAGKRSFAQVGDQILTFTGKAIKQVGEQEGLNNAVPSVNAQFDDKIFKWLNELDTDQSDAVLHFNPDHKLMKLWCNRSGERACRVLDTNIADQPWSRDTNKPAACAVYFKGETFWGSNTEAKIYQDEVGYDDNGLGIRNEIKLADFNVKTSRLSKYFKYQFLYGLLGEATEVTVKIYFDDTLIQQYTLTDSLITISGGSPIGRVLIGGGITTSAVTAQLGYPFEIEKLLKKRRNTGKMSVEFIADGTGQIFEIKGQEINGFYSNKFDRKIRS